MKTAMLAIAAAVLMLAVVPSVSAASSEADPAEVLLCSLSDGVVLYANCVAGATTHDACVILFGAEACKTE